MKADRSSCLSLMTYNVHSCRSPRLKHSLDEVIEVIGSAECDIIALQEVDAYCPRTNSVHQAEEMAKQLNMEPLFFELVNWGSLSDKKEPEGLYGLAYLTKSHIKVSDVRTLRLPGETPKKEPRGMFHLSVQIGDKSISVSNTHLSFERVEQDLQVQAMLEMLDLERDRHSALIMMGDFNIKRRSKALDQLYCFAKECVPCSFPRATFPSYLPLFRLDRVFIDRSIECIESSVVTSRLARAASDHLPVKVKLRL